VSYRSFEKQSQEEAEAYFTAYITAGPERIAWLREKTGLTLEPNRTALVELWQWFLDWAAAGGTREAADGRPMWAESPRPEQGEPLAWDDPRRLEVAGPNPPSLSPATEWIADAMSYFLVECLRAADARIGYRLMRDDPRMAFFNQPVIDAIGTDMIEAPAPITPKRITYAIAPANDWEAEARLPEDLALTYDQILASAAEAKPAPKQRPAQSARELLGHRGVDALYSVEVGADGELVVDFDEDLAFVGSRVIDCVTERLANAARTDREVVTMLAEVDRDQLRAAVRRHLLDCIASESPMVDQSAGES
jgi:hypothetical protein